MVDLVVDRHVVAEVGVVDSTAAEIQADFAQVGVIEPSIVVLTTERN
jgi:hypothetical protein